MSAWLNTSQRNLHWTLRYIRTELCFVAANAAFMAVSAAHFDILPEEALKFVRSQLEYILGVGEHEGRSFMVGFGKDWPQHARHAAA